VKNSKYHAERTLAREKFNLQLSCTRKTTSSLKVVTGQTGDDCVSESARIELNKSVWEYVTSLIIDACNGTRLKESDFAFYSTKKGRFLAERNEKKILKKARSRGCDCFDGETSIHTDR